MTVQAVGRRFALVVAAMVGAPHLLVGLSHPPSESLLQRLGAPSIFERQGGAEVTVQPDDESLPRRFELPGLSPEAGAQLEALVREGVALRALSSGDAFVAAHAIATFPPEAARDIRLIEEQADGATEMTLVPAWRYLEAPTQGDLTAALERAAARDWSLPEGARIAFARAQPGASTVRPTPLGATSLGLWRAYELSAEPLFKESAEDSVTPSPLRPAPRLAERDGGGRDIFVDVTLDMSVVSHDPLFCATRQRSPVMLTVGSRIIAATDREQLCAGATLALTGEAAAFARAEAIAALLEHPALAAGAPTVTVRQVAARDASGRILAARLAPALFFGAIAGLLCWLVLAIARPHWRPTPARRQGPWPWSRLAVTALVPAIVFATSMIPLPGLMRNEPLGRSQIAGLTTWFSLAAVSLPFLLQGYVAVHIIARLPPLWRRRFTSRGRRVFATVAALTGAALVLLHTHVVLESLRDMDALSDDWISTISTGGAAVFTTLGFVGLAWLVNERGLGNGYAVVLISELLARWVIALRSDYGGLQVYTPSAFSLLVVIAFVAALLRWRVGGAEGRASLETPSTGDAPLAVWTLGVAAMIASWLMGSALPFDASSFLQLLRVPWIDVAIGLLLVPFWAWLLARPALVAPFAARAGLLPPARSDAVRAAIVASFFILILGALRLYGGLKVLDLALAALTAAVLLDVFGEARARRQALVPVAELHHIQRASLVEHVLTRAGIDFHLRSRAVRALLSFFGPYAPVLVLVPPDRVDEARVLLAGVLPETIAAIEPPAATQPSLAL